MDSTRFMSEVIIPDRTISSRNELSRHSRGLCRALYSRNVTRSVGYKEFRIWRVFLHPLWIIQHARLDDHRTRKRLSGAEKSRTTITAKVRGDILARVGLLGQGFGRTFICQHVI